MKKRFFASLVLALFAVCLLAGCGGGGGGGPRPNVHGDAYVYSASKCPTIALVDWPGSTSNPHTASSSAMVAQSYSGYIPFSMEAPSAPSSLTVYSVVLFNDLNHDGKFQPSELLGYSNYFVVYETSSKSWEVTDSSGNYKGTPDSCYFSFKADYTMAFEPITVKTEKHFEVYQKVLKLVSGQ